MLLGVERVRRELAGCVDGADEGRVSGRVAGQDRAALGQHGGNRKATKPREITASAAGVSTAKPAD